jgi:hypothetical protein
MAEWSDGDILYAGSLNSVVGNRYSFVYADISADLDTSSGTAYTTFKTYDIPANTLVSGERNVLVLFDVRGRSTNTAADGNMQCRINAGPSGAETEVYSVTASTEGNADTKAFSETKIGIWTGSFCPGSVNTVELQGRTDQGTNAGCYNDFLLILGCRQAFF